MQTVQPQVQHSRTIKRSPIFYGWVIWFVALLGMSATSPGQSFSVSLFIDHYITDFFTELRVGSSTVATLFGAGSFFDQLYTNSATGRTTVSGLYGLGTFCAALSLTFVGQAIDRRGNRLVGTVIIALFAVVLVSLSLIAGPITLFLSFFAIRLLGQGALFLVSSTAVAQWWVVRRGWVMGLALVGFALFQRLYLPTLQQVVESIGWRSSWIVLGAMMGLFMLPMWWLFMRDKPENYGLLPDGETDTDDIADALKPNRPIEENWTLGEAQRIPIFWIFVFGSMFAPAFITGLVFHQVSLFENLGHSALVAAQTYGTSAIINAAVTLGVGRYVSRFRPGYVMAAQLLCLMATMFVSRIMEPEWLLLFFAAGVGATMGIGGAFGGTVWTDMFGRQHQGAIRGFVTTAAVIGSSVGPILFGFSFDTFGSYDPIIWFGIALIFIPTVLSLTVNKPRKREVIG